MAKPRGGHRPGAGRPALPLDQLSRPDLADRRPLKQDRPTVQFKDSAFEGPVNKSTRPLQAEAHD